MGRQRGFTLLEVMMALAILAVALVGLIGRTTANIRISQETAMLGVVTDLARGKMYDIEEELLRDGFQELSQSSHGDFDDEGWRDIRWEAEVQKIELPNQEALKSLEEGGEGDLAGDLAGGEASREGEGGMLGGMMGMLGGGGEGGDDGGMTGAFISAQYGIFSQVLEAAIRKVTLTVTWTVGREEKEMVVACYFTDPAAISQVLPGIGNIGGGGAGGGLGGRGGGGGGLGGGGLGGGGRGGDTQ